MHYFACPLILYLLPEYRDVAHPALYITDQICLLYFFIELVIRLVVSPAKVRFLTRPITVIEILALLPDIVDGLIRVITSSNYEYEKVMEGLNFLKLLRIMRILRLMRQVPGLWILFYTLKASVAVRGQCCRLLSLLPSLLRFKLSYKLWDTLLFTH